MPYFILSKSLIPKNIGKKNVTASDINIAGNIIADIKCFLIMQTMIIIAPNIYNK